MQSDDTRGAFNFAVKKGQGGAYTWCRSYKVANTG